MRVSKTVILLFAVTLLSTVGALASQATFSLEGVQPEERRRLDRYVRPILNGSADKQTVLGQLVVSLNNLGYLDAQVIEQSLNTTVIAGHKVYLADIRLENNDSLLVTVNLPFTQVTLEQAVDQILASQYESGNYYARAEITQIERVGDSVHVRLSLLPGPLVKIARTNLFGLRRTKPATIRRYLPLGQGDTLTENNMARTALEAARIPFVKFIPPITIRPQPGYTEADLDLSFREYPAVTLFGGVGYIPSEDSRLVWNLDLKLSNLFGGGRQIGILTERRESRRTILQLGYRQPMLIAGRGELSLGVSTRDYRDDFYEFALTSGYSTSLSPSFSSSLTLGWRRVDPAEIKPDEPSFSVYQVGFGLTREQIDDTNNPSRGTRLEAEISYVYRRFTGSHLSDSVGRTRDALNETRSHFSTEWFFPVKGKFVLRLKAAYAGLESSDNRLPLSELQLLGGPPTLRGYRNEQFAAKRAAWSTIEPRLRYTSGYLFLFYDAAYINRQSTASAAGLSSELFRDSFGFGLSLVDNDRSVRLSIGWNGRDRENQPRLSVELSTGL